VIHAGDGMHEHPTQALLDAFTIRERKKQLKGLKVAHEYIEKPGLDHGTIIMGAMPDVFAFFPKHVKPARR
jgi:ornithine carbamoyltransferase